MYAQPWLCQKYGTSIKIKSVDDDQEIEYFTSFELEQSGRKKKKKLLQSISSGKRENVSF